MNTGKDGVALQLCTIMRKEPGVRDVEARDIGECRVRTGDDSFAVAARAGGKEYPDRIAGRPALTSHHDDAWVEAKLRDDAGTSLWVSSGNAVELAAKLVRSWRTSSSVDEPLSSGLHRLAVQLTGR